MESGLLLDTHVFLWWRANDGRLNATARAAIGQAPLVFVSAASAWEAAIKAALGRLSLPDRFETGVEESGFQKLIINFAHAEAVARLPAHHADPFDRMLIAQASMEELVLVTHDRLMEPYGVRILWT